jgi:hypothetical protein
MKITEEMKITQAISIFRKKLSPEKRRRGSVRAIRAGEDVATDFGWGNG